MKPLKKSKERREGGRGGSLLCDSAFVFAWTPRPHCYNSGFKWWIFVHLTQCELDCTISIMTQDCCAVNICRITFVRYKWVKQTAWRHQLVSAVCSTLLKMEHVLAFLRTDKQHIAHLYVNQVWRGAFTHDVAWGKCFSWTAVWMPLCLCIIMQRD